MIVGAARVLTVAAACVVSVTAVSPALAGDSDSARPATETDSPPVSEPDAAKERATAHLKRGVEAYRAERYKDAIDAFLEANAEYPSPALSFNTARAYEKMGDSSGALRFYRDYLRRAPDAQDREKVAKRVSELEKKLTARGVQQITVLSTPIGATVVVDGRPVGVTPWTGELLPGAHDLALRLRGYDDAKTRFELQSHRARDVMVTLQETKVAPEPAPTAPQPNVQAVAPAPEADEPSGLRPALWLPPLAVGVGAMGAALALELSSASAEDDARNASDQIAAMDEIDRMNRRQKAARATVGLGAAFTAAGVALLIVDLARGDEGSANASTKGVAVGCTTTGCAATLDGRF